LKPFTVILASHFLASFHNGLDIVRLVIAMFHRQKRIRSIKNHQHWHKTRVTCFSSLTTTPHQLHGGCSGVESKENSRNTGINANENRAELLVQT